MLTEGTLRKCPTCRKERDRAGYVEYDKRCEVCRGGAEKGLAKYRQKKGPKPDSLEAKGKAVLAGVAGLSMPAVIKTEADTETLLNAIWDEVEEARHDPIKFFEFGVRGEKTGEWLTACPHQRLNFRMLATFKQCVIRTPVNTHKSYTVAAWILYLLGKDPTWRGLTMSSTQELASRSVRMVSSYIEDQKLQGPIRMVFPNLQRSERVGLEPWRANEITVKRPPGIRDSSLKALGADTNNDGPRAEFVVVDDLVSHENSLTEAGRLDTRNAFWNKGVSRLDTIHGRAAVINTPWDADDLTFELEAGGWPTCTMDVYGNVRLSNVPPGFASDALVPSDTKPGWMMLRHLAERPPHKRTICDHIYPPEVIAEKERTVPPHNFARQYLCEPLATGSARCQWAWIKECANPEITFVKRYNGPNPVYTGVDVGFGDNKQSDQSAFVTFELLPNRKRRVLWYEEGRWTGPEIHDQVIDHHRRYGSIICVEDNVGQKWIKQFVDLKQKGIRIRKHQTGPTNKHNLDFGVESIFDEIREKAWEFPAIHTEHGLDFEKENGFRAMLYKGCTLYRPPPAHVHDGLMALWIARECCRIGGGGRDPKPRSFGAVATARSGGF